MTHSQEAHTGEHDINETIERFHTLMRHVDLETLIVDVEADTSVPGETIYVIDNPVGTPDDVAIVRYEGGVEGPHKHGGGETEAHIGIKGEATYVLNGRSLPMVAESALVIPTGTPHFAAVPLGKMFTAVVVSSPNYVPENQVELSPDVSEDQATLASYAKIMASPMYAQE